MVNSLFDLGGRIALVSGAASGMGRAMALGFAEAGADLVLADINSGRSGSRNDNLENK